MPNNNKTQPRDNTSYIKYPFITQQEFQSLISQYPDKQPQLKSADSKELIDYANDKARKEQISQYLNTFRTNLLDYLKLGISIANPVAGIALGLGDAVTAVANGDYAGAGVQAGLELIPGISKWKGFNIATTRNLIPKTRSKISGITSPFLSLNKKNLNVYEEYTSEFKEIFDYLSDRNVQDKLKRIDKELGTKYCDAVNYYLDNVRRSADKSGFQTRDMTKWSNYYTGSLGKNVQGLTNFKMVNQDNPLDPGNINLFFSINRPPSTVGHEVKHLIEDVQALMRMSDIELEMAKHNDKFLNAMTRTSPRLTKLTKDVFYSYDEWKNLPGVKQWIKNNPDINKDVYEYLIDPNELNSQLHSLTRQIYPKSGKVMEVADEKELYNLIMQGVTEDKDGSLSIIYSAIKDKKKFIEMLKQYAFGITGIGVNNIINKDRADKQ